jgi:hypothetical protein
VRVNINRIREASLTVGLLVALNAAAARAQPPAVDPDWTPRPVPGASEPWERATDKDWIDGRLRAMDTGPTYDATFAVPSGAGRQLVHKGTAIRVGDRGEGACLFDRCTMRWAAGWTGGFLEHSDRRFGLLNTPTPAGPVVFVAAPYPGWDDPFKRPATEAAVAPVGRTIPLPTDWAHYHGLYLHGRHTVVAYTVGRVEVLDSPWVESLGGTTALTRALNVGPSDQPLRVMVGNHFGGIATTNAVDGVAHAAIDWRSPNFCSAIGYLSSDDKVSLHVAADRIDLDLPPHEKPVSIKVLLWRGLTRELPAFGRLVKASDRPADLFPGTRPGPARWTEPIVTVGEVAPDNAPYVIDTLTVPYDNPHKALFFLTGIDVLPNGDLAVCTCHGDVWVVGGVDATLKRLTWKRFATGLYQPLGLQVVDGKIVVLERGQLTRLHDVNGDGEADFYENLCNAWHTGPGEHSFDTCLETDPAGNFYFFKTGDTGLPHGGCLLRVSKDGSGVEVFATGFRHPIGLGMSPAGIVTGADQEGNWMPATRIDQYRRGGFYGDMRAHHRPTPPSIYDPPLCWLPREVDNSAGGQIWVPEGLFGPLAGRPLHLSYGRCKAMLLMRQTLPDGTVQGGATDLSWNFLSGVKTGRFHPGDGHLYVVGLNGWQTCAKRDGCVQRVRYTGKLGTVPLNIEAYAGALRLTFSQPLDPKRAADVSNYRIERWNYLWSGEYGSKRYSADRPGVVGQDPVTVTAAKLDADGRTVVLTVPTLKPVMQMEVSFKLATESGAPCTGVVYHTIHQMPAINTAAESPAGSKALARALGRSRTFLGDWHDEDHVLIHFDLTFNLCGGGFQQAFQGGRPCLQSNRRVPDLATFLFSQSGLVERDGHVILVAQELHDVRERRRFDLLIDLHDGVHLVASLLRRRGQEPGVWLRPAGDDLDLVALPSHRPTELVGDLFQDDSGRQGFGSQGHGYFFRILAECPRQAGTVNLNAELEVVQDVVNEPPCRLAIEGLLDDDKLQEASRRLGFLLR